MTDFRALCAELLQELCCHYRSWDLKEGNCSDVVSRAQAALSQPKPPSLKEQALEALAHILNNSSTQLGADTIRRALEQLPDNE